MEPATIMDEFLFLLPYWHYKLERPLKQLQKEMKISFEGYCFLRLMSDQKARSMKELTTTLHMSKQQLTNLIGSFYQYGFVKRTVEDCDRRFVKIEITEEALSYLEVMRFDDRFLEKLKESFVEEELLALKNVMTELRKILVK